MAIQLSTEDPIIIAASNVAQPIAAVSRPVTSVIVQADSGNSANVYVGDSTVTTSNGLEIPPGATVDATGDNVGRGGDDEMMSGDIFVISGTAGMKVRIAIFKRKP